MVMITACTLYYAAAFLALFTATSTFASAAQPKLILPRGNGKFIPVVPILSAVHQDAGVSGSALEISKRDIPVTFSGIASRSLLKELESRQTCSYGTYCEETDVCCGLGALCLKCGKSNCVKVGYKCCRDEFYCGITEECHATEVGCCGLLQTSCGAKCCPSGSRCVGGTKCQRYGSVDNDDEEDEDDAELSSTTTTTTTTTRFSTQTTTIEEELTSESTSTMTVVEIAEETTSLTSTQKLTPETPNISDDGNSPISTVIDPTPTEIGSSAAATLTSTMLNFGVLLIFVGIRLGYILFE